MDLTSLDLPQPRLVPASPKAKVIEVPAYTDFKLHDICEPEDAEPLDMNQNVWSPKFREGNRRFLTKRLWGVGNEPPYFHHGLFTTMRRSILAHAGEAQASRLAFQVASKYDQDSLIEFLKTLQVLPPGTKDLIVDENFQPKVWPPKKPAEAVIARSPNESRPSFTGFCNLSLRPGVSGFRAVHTAGPHRNRPFLRFSVPVLPAVLRTDPRNSKATYSRCPDQRYV